MSAMHCVTSGTMMCPMGTGPSSFVATPKQTLSSFKDAGNILDHKPIANIPPFGMCMSMANPAVAAATSAAMGALTPMPCVPNTPAPWVTGAPTVILNSAPALNNTSKLTCVYGGMISFVQPGQVTEIVP
jgi:hypothetical protein